jgi:hypothetical protein
MILQDIETMTDAEKLALVKAIQENVASSKAKQVSMETGQYAKLVVDAIKKIKTDLEERYAAISADIAVKSAAIKDGVDGINGAKGEKGDTGLRGLDGANGRDGVDGKDGIDGVDGTGVTDARIDFDGSLIITLSNGNEINAGEVVPMDVAEKIKVIGNGGGTSQYVLDAIDSLQTQINAVSGGLSYQGTWNASTNTPTLASSTGTSNYYYVVSVSGSTDLNGITDWVTGDWAIYNGTAWQKIDQTNLVTSVAGRTGAVSLSTSDISGLGTIATQNANSVAITGGTATLTSLTTPTVQATNSAGLALKNSAGTTQMSMGGGGGDNISINVSTNLNGTNAQIDISPTGTGHVHMKPSGTGAIEIAPTNVGTIDNMTIGATTAKAITGTTITATTYAGGNVANWDTAYTDRNKWDGGATGLVAATGRTSLGLVIGTDVLAPTGSAASLTNFPTLNQNTTGTAASTPKLLSTNFTIEESGGKLLFKYGATTIASMSSTGLITSAANIVSNGTP